MIRNILHIGMGVVVVFLGLNVLVELLGYVTWYLMPRDAESMPQASEFEAIMGRLVQSPTEGAIQVVVPDRHPKTAKAVHRVMEWPERRGRQFREAPMLQKRVAVGELPPVGERLPGKSAGDCTAPSEWAPMEAPGRGLQRGREI